MDRVASSPCSCPACSPPLAHSRRPSLGLPLLPDPFPALQRVLHTRRARATRPKLARLFVRFSLGVLLLQCSLGLLPQRIRLRRWCELFWTWWLGGLSDGRMCGGGRRDQGRCCCCPLTELLFAIFGLEHLHALTEGFLSSYVRLQFLWEGSRSDGRKRTEGELDTSASSRRLLLPARVSALWPDRTHLDRRRILARVSHPSLPLY